MCVCIWVPFATHSLCNQYAGGTVGTKTDRGVWPPAHSKLKDRDKEEEAPHIFTDRSISSLIHTAFYLVPTECNGEKLVLSIFRKFSFFYTSHYEYVDITSILVIRFFLYIFYIRG